MHLANRDLIPLLDLTGSGTAHQGGLVRRTPKPAAGHSLRRRRLDSPVRRVAHGEPAEQRSEECGTEVVALADRDPPRFPDRWVDRGLDHGWRRFGGVGAGGGPDRGRNCRGGGMVRATAFCLVAVDPGYMRGNGGWPNGRRGAGRL